MSWLEKLDHTYRLSSKYRRQLRKKKQMIWKAIWEGKLTANETKMILEELRKLEN